MSQSAYKRIDHGVYLAERALVVVSLVVMAVVVFLDVVHRTFASEESKFALVVAKIAKWVGSEIEVGTPAYDQLASASPWVMFTLFTGLAYFGIRSVKRETPVPHGLALAAGAAGVVVTYGLVRLLLAVMPNGLIWSQPVALVLTLWVGFVGASMCTYEGRHLRVEAAARFLPEKIRPYVGFVSGLLTTTVCVGLLWVSIRYVLFNYHEYVDTEGQGGLVPSTDVPKYLGFAALPISFAFMSVRFFVKSLAALRGEVEASLDPVEAAGGMPMLDLEDEADSGGPRPSDVPTEALPLMGRSSDRQSAIDTLTSSSQVNRHRPGRPPSKVPTDAHPAIPPASGSLEVSDAARSGALEAVGRPRPASGEIPSAVATADGEDDDEPDGDADDSSAIETKKLEGAKDDEEAPR